MTETAHRRYLSWGILLAVRLVIGIVLISCLVHVSVDDAFRVFYARWWFDHPSFYPIAHWPPGYFWLYGIVTGISGDMLVAPRVLTLLVHLSTGLLLWFDSEASPRTRWAAAAWMLLSPLSLVLGTVPLSESLFVMLVMGGAICLIRYLSSPSVWTLVGAAALYLLAATVRYEGWLILVVFTAISAFARPPRVSSVVAWSARLVPWAFPAIWIATLWGVEARPFLFLDNVATDSFGAGNLADSFAEPVSWVVLLQLIAVLAALAPALGALASKRARVERVVWEAHVVTAGLFVLWAIVSGNVPSQYPARIVFPMLAFGSVPVARLLFGPKREPVKTSRLVLGAGSMLVIGVVYALSLSAGHDVAAREIGERIHAHEGHVVIDMKPPRTMTAFVFANDPDRVHLDRNGEKSWLTCGHDSVPDWMDDVDLVAVTRKSNVHAMGQLGWTRVGDEGPWTLFSRPDGGAPLSSCGLTPPRDL